MAIIEWSGVANEDSAAYQVHFASQRALKKSESFSGDCLNATSSEDQVVYKSLNSTRTLGGKLLYTFTGGNDGANPYGLTMGSDGNLYGTAFNGGSEGNGTVWGWGLSSEVLTVAVTDIGDGTSTGTGTVGGSSTAINNCTGTCSASFTEGTVVTLTANPGTGSTFTGWSNETGAAIGSTCTGTTSPCTVTMSAAAGVTATFNPPTPTSISCQTPAAITYGTPLSAPNCTETPTVTGTWSYSPLLGTVLSAGNQYVTVTFTPSNPTYAVSTTNVPIQVNQATPTITWAPPAAITFGTALSSTQLDATASVPGTFVYSPAAGTVLTAGSQTLSVTFTPTDNINYTTTTATVPLTVNPGAVNCSWPPPAPITYGTPLSATQLDATCAVAGTFAYSPVAGTVLGAGIQTLSVTFTPTDTTDYQPITFSTSILVNQVTTTINWPNPAAITYGTALSASQLDATAATAANQSKGRRTVVRVKPNDSVAGSYAYTAQLSGGQAQPVQVGTVLSAAGSYTLSVTFTPTDSIDYAPATASVPLTVGQATPVITWTTPGPITYPTALSATQLDATANVAGTFVYSPAAGTVLNAGSQTLSVTFTPTDTTDYTTATGSTTLTVNQAPQTIKLTFNPTTVLTNGAAAGDTFTVTATGGTSGNPVVLTASGTCINSGATYVMTGGPNSTGTCNVIANQAGNNNYSAGSTTQPINEVKKVGLTAPTVTLTTTAPTAGAPYKSQFTVTATTNASTTATITAAPSTVCTISGNAVTMKSGAGTCTVTAKWKADEYYSAATATQAVSAAKLASIINWAPPASIAYGPLGSILNATVAGSDGTTLTGTWAYTEAPSASIPPQPVTAKTVLAVGSYLLTANFTPTGTFAKDYAVATAVTVPVAVTQATTTTTISSATAGKLKVTVDFTVAGENGGKVTGTVNVSDSTGAFTCSATLAANGTGHCPITFTGTAGANVTLTATYAGDTNDSGSVSAPYSTTD